MARPKVSGVSGPSRITPVAQPVDAYVVPAQAPQNNLNDLARGLAAFDSGLTAFLGKRKKKQDDVDRVQGEDAFNKNNRQGWSDAVKDGSVPPQSSPVFVKSYKNAQGTHTGIDLRRKWNEAYFNWEGRDSDDPQKFDDFFGQFLKENIKTDDVDVLRSLNPHIKRLATDAYNHHIKLRGTRSYQDSLDTNSSIIHERIKAARSSDESKPKGANYDGLWKTLTDERNKAITSGTRREDYDKIFIDAIITSAVEAGDTKVLELLDRKLPGADKTLASTSEGIKRKAAALHNIEVGIRSKMRDESRVAKAKDKALKGDVLRHVTGNLLKDPNYIVPPEVMKKWLKVDPLAQVKFLDIRKKLLDGKGKGDPSALLDLHQRLRGGASEDAVHDAVKTGIIRTPQEYKAANELVDKYRKATERNSVILKSGVAKRYVKAIKTRTDGTTQDIFGTKGLTNDGLKATQQFEDDLLDWDSRNPEATALERRAAIKQIGDAILGDIETDQGETNVGKYDPSPTQKGDSKSNKGDAQPVTPSQPKKIIQDRLPSTDNPPQKVQKVDTKSAVFPIAPSSATPVKGKTNPLQLEDGSWVNNPAKWKERSGVTFDAGLDANNSEGDRTTLKMYTDETGHKFTRFKSLQDAKDAATNQDNKREDAKPLVKEQRGKLGTYGGEQPPKIDDLPAGHRSYLKERSEKTGKSEEEINKMLWQRLRKIIKKSTYETSGSSNTSLVNAVIRAESNGNPRAVSNKGAVGIMQVMPGTAKEIAKELGDKNFPSNSTKVAAYLKDPKVGQRYGEYYLNKQLKAFKGDTEAALIAYNAGPGNARKWIKANRDYSVLPDRKQTEGYVRKISRYLNKSPQGRTAQGDLRRYLVKGKSHSHADGLSGTFKGSFSRMMSEAPPEVQKGLKIFSGHRSRIHQAKLWKAALKKYGSAAKARRWVAPPGRSEHNHGDAADLRFASKAVKKWVHANAKRYGLHFRMGHEAWHISVIKNKSKGKA